MMCRRTLDTPAEFTDRDLSEMILINMPERVKRVEQFSMVFSVVEQNGNIRPCITCLDDVVGPRAAWQFLRQITVNFVNSHETNEANVEELQLLLTKVTQQFLYTCVFRFADEADPDDIIPLSAKQFSAKQLQELDKCNVN